MKNNLEANKEQTTNVSNAEAGQADRDRVEKADAAAEAEPTTIERIETAADELFRLRAQSAYVNERVRNLATILELATVVIGLGVERSELVLHGLTGAKQICDALIAATD